MFIARWNDQLNFYPPPQPRFIKRLPAARWAIPNSGFPAPAAKPVRPRDLDRPLHLDPLLTNTATLYDYADPAATTFLHESIEPCCGQSVISEEGKGRRRTGLNGAGPA